MPGSARFASIIDPGEETRLSPVVVMATTLLIVGFVASFGYWLLHAVG